MNFILFQRRQSDGRLRIPFVNQIQSDRVTEFFLPDDGAVGFERIKLFAGRGNDLFPTVIIQVTGN